jgi:hypothetical protein
MTKGKSQAKSMKEVSFAANIAQLEIMGLDEYTQKEIQDTWYTEEETNTIAMRCIKILAKIESGKAFNGKRYCVRGLESHTNMGYIAKKRSRETAIVSVLEEQKRQFEASGVVDVESISKVYKRTTSSHQMWAQVMASGDKQEADAYLFENEDDYYMAEWQTSDPISLPDVTIPAPQKTIPTHPDPKLDSAKAAKAA